jgi:hypothetical protein
VIDEPRSTPDRRSRTRLILRLIQELHAGYPVACLRADHLEDQDTPRIDPEFERLLGGPFGNMER